MKIVLSIFQDSIFWMGVSVIVFFAWQNNRRANRNEVSEGEAPKNHSELKETISEFSDGLESDWACDLDSNTATKDNDDFDRLRFCNTGDINAQSSDNSDKDGFDF